MKQLLLSTFILTCLSISPLYSQPLIIDFDQSLNIRSIERPFPARIKHLAYEFITKPAPYTQVLSCLRSLYEQHKQALAMPGNV